MASKKYTLLSLMMALFVSGAFAQLAGTLDYSDSSKFNAKKMAQFNEWANGLPSSPFAPKPRDAWQMSVFGGYAGVFGDVRVGSGWGIGIGARKALGYVVSVRPGISYRKITGLAYENHFNTQNLRSAVRDLYTAANLRSFVAYYESEQIIPSLDFLVSLNNVMFHRKQSNYNFYLVGGYSMVIFNTQLEALDGQGRPHNYAGVNFSGKRSDIQDQLRNYFDQNGGVDFETESRRRPRRNNFNDSDGKNHFVHAANVGAGFERRLGDVVTLTAEGKYTFLWDEDWADGIAIGGANAPTGSDDVLFMANIGVNFNLGVKGRKKFAQMAGKDDAGSNDLGQFPGKRVAPLWMHNPLGQPYGELANPTRMNMPASWLQDSDSDGVPDQFDLEPNTPAGAPVDTRGRTRDTDGDGVPDYLDKELITPTYCQGNVDADGVGKCPDPACCDKIVVPPPAPACNIGSLPSVQFEGGRSSLSTSSNAILDAAASSIKANPLCKICVVGHGGSSKREQQLSWDRVNRVINYMVEKQGISRDRFVFKFGESGDANTVDLQDCTGEDGPNMVNPPHPQYRTSK